MPLADHLLGAFVVCSTVAGNFLPQVVHTLVILEVALSGLSLPLV